MVQVIGKPRGSRYQLWVNIGAHKFPHTAGYFSKGTSTPHPLSFATDTMAVASARSEVSGNARLDRPRFAFTG
jgi:hypothetical protein